MLRAELGNDSNDSVIEKVWSFKDLLSWKMPEHLSTNNAKNLNKALARVHA